MKKIIFILLFVFLFSSSYVFARKIITIKASTNSADVHVHVLCIDGYKYILVRNDKGYIDIKQMHERTGRSNHPQPITCK